MRTTPNYECDDDAYGELPDEPDEDTRGDELYHRLNEMTPGELEAYAAKFNRGWQTALEMLERRRRPHAKA